MLRQIKLLSGIQLVNLFGFNEVRHTKDRSKKTRYFGMCVAWLIVLVMILAYIAMSSYGYIMLGMAQIIPAYLYTMTSLLMLCFTFLKAGSIIFQMKSYEMMVSLPVSGAAIVISRFLTMYVTNFLIGALVMVPGMAVYGVFKHPGIGFYTYGILGAVLLPLLPLSIATALGAGIMALTARMRHKSIASSLLMVLVVIAVLIGSMVFPGMGGSMNEFVLQDLAVMLNEQISRVYPPAIWFQRAVLEGNVNAFLMLLLVSAGLFAMLMGVLQRHFLSICTALNATSARNDYKMERLSTNSVVKALWKKEMKRYFASSIYVVNTITGYVLMAVAAAALFIMGPEKLEASLGMPGITREFMPLVLSLTAVIMPSTSCSISMEGATWWRLQTLPVRAKDIWNGKVLWNLTLALPFYSIAVILSILTLKPSLPDALCLILVPACYILFSCVAGITINLAMPIFNWENETRVVKQSASAFVTMLVGLASIVPPVVCMFVLPEVSADLIYLGTAVVLLALTGVLYQKNGKQGLLL